MIRRARLLSVVVIVACGALGVISSTQTWLTVTLADGAEHALEVAGSAALPVLAPLSLAVLALGAALSIVGAVLRYVFGGLTLVIAALLAWLTFDILLTLPTSSFASAVTQATGITGESAVAGLVDHVVPSAWPGITLAVWIALIVAGVFVLATARGWRGSGRRYRTDDDARPGAAAASRPHDAIDDWDDLSRGEDPTARPLD